MSTGILKFQDQNLNLPIKNNLIKNDHAFYNPLADIKKYFPNATVYPISIGQKIDSSSLDNLITQVSNICGFDCLLVASVDFSHYLPATLAEVHDAYTLTNLQNLDSFSIQLSEVDSPQSLYFLIKYALQKNTKNWHIFAHTNSGFLINSPDVETTTHVFGYYNLGINIQSNTYTSIQLPYPLERSQNQDTVGDRFFYGTHSFISNSTIPNFVIGQIKNSTQDIEIYLPIKENLFVRGNDKKILIKNYFDSLPNDQNLTKDYFWGKLIYDRK